MGIAGARPRSMDLGCDSQLAGRVGFRHSMVYLPYWIPFGGGISTIIGTLELLTLTFIQRTIFEIPLVFSDVFSQIVLPTVLLNLLLAIPVHALIRDLAERLYPEKVMA